MAVKVNVKCSMLNVECCTVRQGRAGLVRCRDGPGLIALPCNVPRLVLTLTHPPPRPPPRNTTKKPYYTLPPLPLGYSIDTELVVVQKR